MRLINDITPKPIRIKPDIRLIHFIFEMLIFNLKEPTLADNRIHHNVDPINTPKMRKKGDVILAEVFNSPIPENIAVKEIIVIGLDSVSKKVEMKFETRFFLLI
jgi:hypothetical protein